jgi:hypothetical protein
MKGEVYRRNLITVPSCAAHNMKKSGEDEFLMVCLAGIIGNNSVGYRHHAGKVGRAIRRTAGRLLREVLGNHQQIRLEIGRNEFVDVIVGTPDLQRLLSSLELIAYGLHLHHFRRRFVGRVRVMAGFVTYSEENSRSLTKLVEDKAAIELEGTPALGENPEVFSYAFGSRDNLGLYLLRMVFYGGVAVLAAFQEEGVVVQDDLPMTLIKMGVPTRVETAGNVYSFNTEDDEIPCPHPPKEGV